MASASAHLRSSPVPWTRVGFALRRARGSILASLATYAASVLLGIALATAGWPVAVAQRDAIVGGAQGGAVLQAYRHGDRVKAALLDFGSNLLLGAVPTSITGLAVVGPFPIAAYTGWVGGIVSIDAEQRSRLRDPNSALYYLVVIALQLLGFGLTMGAGVHAGLAAWGARNDESVRSWLGFRLPGWALADAGCLYLLAIPFFLAGSLWEFLA